MLISTDVRNMDTWKQSVVLNKEVREAGRGKTSKVEWPSHCCILPHCRLWMSTRTCFVSLALASSTAL